MYQALLSGGVLELASGNTIKRDMSSPSWLAYCAWLKDGNAPTPPDVPAPHVPTPEEVQAAVVLATQSRLDAFARTRGYDGILSACTYATSTAPKFSTEGQYAVTARDATWGTLYALMGEVQAGARPMPSGFSEVEALLPALEWPV